TEGGGFARRPGTRNSRDTYSPLRACRIDFGRAISRQLECARAGNAISYRQKRISKQEVKMTNYPKITFGFLVLLAAVALTGCSSTAKPDVASAVPASAPAESKKELTPAPSGSTTKSSLEALQRGEST